MAIRFGIELSPVACRIVAVDATRRGDPSNTRVTFATMTRSGSPAVSALASLRGQRAAVVIWAAGADHRQVVVTDGSYEHMQAEARAAVRDAGCSFESTLADIAPLPESAGRRARRTVLLASAASADVSARLQPLMDAGVRVDRVLTPAAALLSLARARRAKSSIESRSARSSRHSSPGQALEAYVAIDETSGCLALIRDGALLGGMDLAWGYVEELGGQRGLRTRDDIVLRLADDLTVFMEDCDLDRERLRHVCVCGGVPDLRSMTMMLMQQLDVEVEPLDSLFAIDESQLPGNADEFRDRAPALRLAWAAAADPRPPLDLFRLRRRHAWGVRLARAVVAAGTAAGLALGWEIQDRWQPVVLASPAASVPDRSGSAVGSAPAEQNLEMVVAWEPSAAPLVPAADVAPVTVTDNEASRTIPRPIFRAVHEPGPVPPPVVTPVRPPVVAPVPVRPPIVTPAPVRAPVVTPAPAPPPLVTPLPVRPPVAAPVPVRPPVVLPLLGPRTELRPREASSVEARQGPRAAAKSEEIALPFEAALESILYGPDRRLAMVDGRIVEAGDVVRGATIVEITTTAVMLRDDRGRLRRLTAGSRGR